MTPSNADLERIVREVVKRLSSVDAPVGQESPSPTSSANTAVIIDRVVTLNSVESVLSDNLKQIEVQRGAVVTPSARDLLRDKNLTLLETATQRSTAAPVWLGIDGRLPQRTLRWIYSRGEAVAPSGPLPQQLQWLENKLIARQDSVGLVISDRPMRAAAIANRRPALRAAVVASTADLATAHQQMQANLLAACAGTPVDQLSAMVNAAATLSRVPPDATDPLLRSHS